MAARLLLLLLAASSGARAHARSPPPLGTAPRRPTIHAGSASASPSPRLLPPRLARLRGGAARRVEKAALARAKALLVLSNAGFGSYSVFLRALREVPRSEPLGTVFITFVRYSFLFLFAFLMRTVRTAQARGTTRRAPRAAADHGAGRAAFELAALTVCTSLLSIYGTCRVTSAMSEIFASTDNVFVPLMSVLAGMADFGARTWAACALAFGAAVLTAAIDSVGGHAAGAAAAPFDVKGAAALTASALVYAGYRARTTIHLRTHAAEHLNLLRMLWMGALSAAALLVDESLGGASATSLRRLAYIRPAQWGLLGAGVFVSGFLSGSLQFEAMRSISAAKAQPFSALQTLFAGLFGWLALREPVSVGTWVGGSFMIAAALLACTERDEPEEPPPPVAAVEEIVKEATPNQVVSLFPLESRLDIVEGAIVDEVIHPFSRELVVEQRPSGLKMSAATSATVLLATAMLIGKKRRRSLPDKRTSKQLP
ncbi:hypothetical protein AB1Y20_008141 [Prymnesium parvum]|uniref:EamA domain-containing protein n=1 Tax=Prymnesium parvum TaxID=97485 RepID=A0AB34ITV2_PRYPA